MLIPRSTVPKGRFVLYAAAAMLGVSAWIFYSRPGLSSGIKWTVPHRALSPLPTDLSSSSRLSSILFPVHSTANERSWINHNHKMTQALLQCIERHSCEPNQEKVIILGSYHFRGAFWGWVGGEDIWARSTIQALDNLGYTYYYTSTTDHAVQLYQMFPSLVRAVLMEDSDTEDCFRDTEDCVLSEENPHGIPLWKILNFRWWPGGPDPLGLNWTLMPEPYQLEGHIPSRYLGYSVETACHKRTFIPHTNRPAGRAYIMAKRFGYFHDYAKPAWPQSYYSKAMRELTDEPTQLEFVMGAGNDTNSYQNGDGSIQGPWPLESLWVPGVKNFGRLDQAEFLDHVANSRVLIGVGMPVASPTPYDALCLGVPFINPIKSWDENDPTNRFKWDVQHGLLKFLDPPYVYNVRKDDPEGFVNAIREAIANPIESYVLPRMRLTEVERRLEEILETDYKQMAIELIESRKKSGEGPLFMI